METFILYFAAIGMVVGALMLLGSVGTLLYVIFIRGRGTPTASSGSHVATDNPSGHSGA